MSLFTLRDLALNVLNPPITVYITITVSHQEKSEFTDFKFFSRFVFKRDM